MSIICCRFSAQILKVNCYTLSFVDVISNFLHGSETFPHKLLAAECFLVIYGYDWGEGSTEYEMYKENVSQQKKKFPHTKILIEICKLSSFNQF